MQSNPQQAARGYNDEPTLLEIPGDTITGPPQVNESHSSLRRLRNNAVEHGHHQQSSAARPLSTSTVSTAHHVPIPASLSGILLGTDKSLKRRDTGPPTPTHRHSFSPPRSDAPLLGNEERELTVPSPTRSRTSVNLDRFSDTSPHRHSQTASLVNASDSDSQHHHVGQPPMPRSTGLVSAHRSPRIPTERSTSYSWPDRPPNSAAIDSPDEAAPPDFRRRSSSTQQHSRSRRPPSTLQPPASSDQRLSQIPAPSPAGVFPDLIIYSYLIFFSIFGTLARLGLQWLTFYPGAPVVTSTLWANFAGSLVMGFLAEDKRLFGSTDLARHSRYSSIEPKADSSPPPSRSDKKTIPLYIGLATGFCGSLTSFSSFQRDTFLALSNHLPAPYYHSTSRSPDFTPTTPRHGGYSFMAVAAITITELGLSFAAIFIGSHLALATQPILPSLTTKLVRQTFATAVLFLGPGIWLGAILLSIFPPDATPETWRGTVLFALVFAPIGCMLRYLVSLHLNRLTPSFPLGTFSVNIFGSAVLAASYDLQHVRLAGSAIGGGQTGCQVLQGIQDGFCGCLTTVSTFVLELVALAGGNKAGGRRRARRDHGIRCAWVYGAASVLTGLGIMVIVMGSVLWTAGWEVPACVTMRTVS